MASVSSVTLTLVDKPPIYYGFWHSYGSSFPPGPVLTTTTSVFALATSALALFIAWVASRLWCIIDVLIFRSIYERTKTSLEESQCAALLVNSTAPLSAFTAASELIRRGGPKNTLIRIIIASVFVLSLTAAIPLFIAIFPTRREGLISPVECGYSPETIRPDSWNLVAKLNRYSNAALISTDQNRTQSKQEQKATTLSPLPRPHQSYVRQCPTGVTCHPDYPFNFSSVYTLTSKHMGLNTDLPFTVQVSDTCYRPIEAKAIANDSFAAVLYGLYYGITYDTQGNEYPYTDSFYQEQQLAPGYALRSYRALTDDVSNTNFWNPNATLVMGGDTTIFFYYIGFVLQTQESDDPIFATNFSATIDGLGTFHSSRDVVSTIICDTKYTLCVDDGQDCSPNGPASHVLSWINATKVGERWRDIYTFFDGSTLSPPIYAASWGSGSVAAAQTLLNTAIQSDSANNTVTKELRRLSQAGMTIMASGPQLAALGYWNIGEGTSLTPSTRHCSNIVIGSSSAVSILLAPYWLFLSFSATIVVLSYAHLFGATRLRSWQKYADPWALYSAGQLHRQVIEQHGSTLENAKSRKMWPSLKSRNSYAGLEVADRRGSKALIPGSSGSVCRPIIVTLNCPVSRQPRRHPRGPSTEVWASTHLSHHHCRGTPPGFFSTLNGPWARSLSHSTQPNHRVIIEQPPTPSQPHLQRHRHDTRCHIFVYPRKHLTLRNPSLVFPVGRERRRTSLSWMRTMLGIRLTHLGHQVCTRDQLSMHLPHINVVCMTHTLIDLINVL